MRRLIVPLLALASTAGCATSQLTCASCPPRIEVQRVDRPVPCVIPIKELGVMILPALPMFPGDEATDAEIDVWLTDLKAAIEAREAFLQARVSALESQIKAHNKLTPLCSN